MKIVILSIKQDLANYLQRAFAKHMHDGVLCLPVQSPFYRFVSEKLYATATVRWCGRKGT